VYLSIIIPIYNEKNDPADIPLMIEKLNEGHNVVGLGCKQPGAGLADVFIDYDCLFTWDLLYSWDLGRGLALHQISSTESVCR
jgi:hypothetical protein